jgi:DNA replication protein DnaC
MQPPSVPPRPTRPAAATQEAFAEWIRALEEWNAHPAVVAEKEAEAKRVEMEALAARPTVACTECQIVRVREKDHPWEIVHCGPHRVDYLMSSGSSYLPIPRRYATADPAHLIAALRDWTGESGVYLTGPVGTGKTYQAAALVKHAFRVFDRQAVNDVHDPYYMLGFRVARPVVWANVPGLLEDIRRSYDAPDALPENLTNAPLLVLDDIGAEKPSEWVEERLYCIVNERYENALPVIVTSNLTPAQLGDRVGARITSRLVEMCDVHGLGGRDRRMGRVA